MTDYISLPLPEETIIVAAADALALPKAHDFAGTVLHSASSTLVECRQIVSSTDPFFKAGDEIVIFDVLIAVGQRPANDIRYSERIAVHFDAADQMVPWVFALRSDFPKVPHRNALYFDEPQCLCVYETRYEELKLDWRSVKFLADIRTWLQLTSEGKLHQHDQPLEPLLVTNMGTIIIPPGIKEEDTLTIYHLAEKGGRNSFLASHIKLPDRHPSENFAVILKGKPQPNGVMGREPRSLNDLHQLLKPASIDLFNTLREKLTSLNRTAETLAKRLIILLEIPKTRDGINSNEFDHYAMLTAQNIEEIALSLGFWAKGPEGLGEVLFTAINEENGTELELGILLPQLQLTPDFALLLSGNAAANWEHRHTRIFQIGAGALGSQFLMNQARSGFGRWGITDDDFLMPHNLVRHALDNTYLGNLKSFALAAVINQFFGGEVFVEALAENYLHPQHPHLLNEQLAAAEIILDISTSIAVARHLAVRTDIAGRRVSMFLTPSGNDLVILAEDAGRALPLDVLEFQYYQQLIINQALEGHLKTEPGIRLSNSCRDVTSRIAQEHVAMLAAIASSQFRKIIKNTGPLIGIWRISQDTLETKSFITQPSAGDTWQVGEWTIYVDQPLIEKIREARLKRLPNETGGILIGGYDLERKKIYLVDTILSPADSQEYPTAYIRGTAGVETTIAAIDLATAEHLKYVGEWHSHPKGCALEMSEDDQTLFAYLDREMQGIGLPAIMLIAGDDKKYQLYMQQP
jgi:hypothetical protein